MTISSHTSPRSPLSARDLAATRIFESSSALLASANDLGFFTALNPAWGRTLGFDVEALTAQPFLEFVHPEDRDATAREMAKLKAEGVGSGRFENRFAVVSGGWRWLAWQAEILDSRYYFTVLDVTERVTADHRAHLLSSIVEGVDDAIASKTTDGVVTSWNRASEDMYGYTAAEAIGQPLNDLIVPPDRSGEPAAIIASLLEGRGVRQYTTQRRRKDGTPLTVSLTASLVRDEAYNILGAAVVSRDISLLGLEDLKVRAEVDALAWVGRIRDAIDEDRICFFAQPIVSLGGEARSYELLCRMRDRDGNIVPPWRFLSAAENYGLIEELDLLAVDEAARQVAAGHEVAVNLSTASVGCWHIVDVIAQRLSAAGADPCRLTVEITETALMKNIATAQRFANGVTALGCRVALDDFGTGFGGFTYLKKLHIDRLKIDIEFIRDLESSEASQHVVKAVVALAHGLHLDTVAEGVEDEQTLALLAALGVTHAQGYYFARPGPIDEVLDA